MFAAGENFFVEVDTREYQLRFHRFSSSSSSPTIVQHGRGQSVIAIAAAGSYCAVMTTFPQPGGGGGKKGSGMAQDASVYECVSSTSTDDDELTIRQLWSANLPPELYARISSSCSPQQQQPQEKIALCVERGGNGGIAIGWPSSDVVAIFEPPSSSSSCANVDDDNDNNHKNQPTFVVCRKRTEHPPSHLALGTDLLFTISGKENRLQSWSRHSGDSFREGGLLSSVHRVTCLTYETSEGVLIVGFDNGTVRLISVEKHSMMTSLATIDIGKAIESLGTLSSSSSPSTTTTPILASSFAQSSTGETLVVCPLGIMSLNLRTQKVGLKMEFFQQSDSYCYEAACVSSSNDFCLVGLYNDGNEFELIEITSSSASASSSSPSVSRNQPTMAANSVQVGRWSNRIQVGDRPGQAGLAIHDNVSVISSATTTTTYNNHNNTPSIVSSFARYQQNGDDRNNNDQMEFNFAQHSDISYNERLSDFEEEEGNEENNLEEEANFDEEVGEGEERETEDVDDDIISNIEPDQSDIESVLADQQQGTNNSASAGSSTVIPPRSIPRSSGNNNNNNNKISSTTWQPRAGKQQQSMAVGGKKGPMATLSSGAKIPSSLPSSGKKMPASLIATKKPSAVSTSGTLSKPKSTLQQKEDQQDHQQDSSPKLTSDVLFVLPNFNQDLPPALKAPFELPQEKQDPKAKPVTFRRGGPIKGSGYSASSNVPWSVQQAEKQKQKKKLAAAATKAKQQQALMGSSAAVPFSGTANNGCGALPQPTSIANYNTAAGVTGSEHAKINSQVLDKTSLHSSTITTSCFDLLGNVLFTASNDGTCHLLKFGANTLLQGKYEGQAFSGATAVDGQRKGENSAISVVSGTGAAASSSVAANNTSHVASTSDSSSSSVPPPPILSLDVGIGNFNPSSINSRTVSLSSPQSIKSVSWNVFATSAKSGAVTVWVPNNLQSGGASAKIRHVFAKDARAVRFAMRDSLLLVANGGSISTCRYVLDLHKDELHRGRNLSRFSVVSEFSSAAQSVLSMDTFNTLDSSLVAFGTSSKQVGVLDLRRPDAACWSIDEAHARPVHSVVLQRSSAFSDVSSLEETFGLFASSSVDNCVKLWDLRTRNAARVLNKHTNTALQLGLCISPCSRYVACGSEDRSVVIYDVAMGRILSKIRCPDQVTSLRYHPLKPMLFAGLANGKGKVFYDTSQRV